MTKEQKQQYQDNLDLLNNEKIAENIRFAAIVRLLNLLKPNKS
jgi:hypothetical protein